MEGVGKLIYYGLRLGNRVILNPYLQERDRRSAAEKQAAWDALSPESQEQIQSWLDAVRVAEEERKSAQAWLDAWRRIVERGSTRHLLPPVPVGSAEWFVGIWSALDSLPPAAGPDNLVRWTISGLRYHRMSSIEVHLGVKDGRWDFDQCVHRYHSMNLLTVYPEAVGRLLPHDPAYLWHYVRELKSRLPVGPSQRELQEWDDRLSAYWMENWSLPLMDLLRAAGGAPSTYRITDFGSDVEAPPPWPTQMPATLVSAIRGESEVRPEAMEEATAVLRRSMASVERPAPTAAAPCRHAIDASDHFCTTCGAPTFGERCAACGGVLKRGASFCGNCGRQVSEQR